MPYSIQIICIVFIVISCLLIVIRPGWRVFVPVMLSTHFLQFAFLLYTTSLFFSVINLMISWMAIAVIGFTSLRSGMKDEIFDYKAGTAFILISEFFFILSGFALSFAASPWLSRIPFLLIAAGSILLLTGVFLLNTCHHSWQVIFSLLLLLAGFELIYYSLEYSLLVVVLMGLVKFALAFTGSYIIAMRQQGSQ